MTGLTGMDDAAVVADHASLRALVGEAGQNVLDKDIGRIDRHAADFIARSPFVLLATSGPDGTCDVSPRGENPGGFLVVDERTIAIPDRPGNRRLDSLTNLIDNPEAGLLFCVPGMEETLRVNGAAQIVTQASLLQQMAVNGRPPTLAIRLRVRELYFHCAKAFRRSGLWKPESWPDRSELPTLGRIVKDQSGTTVPAAVIDAGLAADARTNLY
ncbi:pyridoxamine 5'-phosphate oxidase family protein [Nocardiopsis ansamitocini]|uniref:Pyridoxamine 5'-phosphate oxidase-like FMN-binding protein n=1 Tax=Nocardiopsis ansamitocini TaxID=1670832 RepID=A0A9W6P6V7_9ACTN|nr:pyridoxamine 5'-phosphate oxidase family protein [Nocardiopsis ansamitocini]GLU48133.1 pyridoxamine 5'-phosphate oxidase-like FMN-binding protein [Nocardiopsis ansamitocini]